MRGTPPKSRGMVRITRFIPAYAGNTACRRREPERKPVHPRVCGEHLQYCWKNEAFPGSSPRMRGTLGEPTSECFNDRFIPAYAGNTIDFISGDAPDAVHPRVCGEHATKEPAKSTSSGSSPRMRGTQASHRAMSACHRFIPAYAGNTQREQQSGRCRSVHPRVCGEH